MSRDEENEYFADGLAEELLNVLAKIRGLRVAARSSAFTFKGKGATVAEVGRALNVATVLEGRLTHSSSRCTPILGGTYSCASWESPTEAKARSCPHCATG
jgi:TolB-like protein